jgi:cell division protein ZapE
MPQSIRTAYETRLKRGEIAADAAQAQAVESLARLEGELNGWGEPGFSLNPFRRREPPRGVYLHGPVGRGKSMLMDLFFDSAPVTKKRRAHFHAFMAGVHADIKAWREGDAAARRAHFGVVKGDDPIVPTAHRIAEAARLLCFDEFHVTDIADAMILGRLFEALFERGVVIVATSNRAPDGLYPGGINRQLFLPFIDLIRARMEVVEVAGPKDFRLDRLAGQPVYFTPVDAVQSAAFDALWTAMLAGDAETGATLNVLGRQLTFPHAVGGRLKTHFNSVCGLALGPQDYLAIAERFHTVFLWDVPRLSAARRNEAARFVTLIDALYEARAKLVMLAEAEPEDLYPAGDGAFEFERTASRLQEMRSADYIAERPAAG